VTFQFLNFFIDHPTFRLSSPPKKKKIKKVKSEAQTGQKRSKSGHKIIVYQQYCTCFRCQYLLYSKIYRLYSTLTMSFLQRTTSNPVRSIMLPRISISQYYQKMEEERFFSPTILVTSESLSMDMAAISITTNFISKRNTTIKLILALYTIPSSTL
jgi:hypothetical protein